MKFFDCRVGAVATEPRISLALPRDHRNMAVLFIEQDCP